MTATILNPETMTSEQVRDQIFNNGLRYGAGFVDHDQFQRNNARLQAQLRDAEIRELREAMYRVCEPGGVTAAEEGS